MFDFVPVNDYTHYFNVTVLCMVLLAFWQCNRGLALKKEVASLNALWGFLFTIVLIFYMGLRPVSFVFGDTVNYAHIFNMLKEHIIELDYKQSRGEWVFASLQYWFSQNSDIHSFFLFCAFIYVASQWIAMYRIFKGYYYIPFLVLISMFTFWSFGVNGIRNGMAAALVILALTFINQKFIMLILFVLAVGIHKSLLLIIVAAAIAYYYRNTALYVFGWLSSILISAVFGSMVSNYLMALGFISDDRFENYLTNTELAYQFSSTGFRWDFLAYSALPVIVGYYFIFRRNFKDEYYQWMYSIYLMANAFWIIVIRAMFSNRFAQISWFIMPIILIYPFMKQRFWVNHEKILGLVLLIFYSYTFYTYFL